MQVELSASHLRSSAGLTSLMATAVSEQGPSTPTVADSPSRTSVMEQGERTAASKAATRAVGEEQQQQPWKMTSTVASLR